MTHNSKSRAYPIGIRSILIAKLRTSVAFIRCPASFPTQEELCLAPITLRSVFLYLFILTSWGYLPSASAQTEICELYPIALHVDSLANAEPGDEITDVLNGSQSGNFGWLTWAGSPSTPNLTTSLTPPGNSTTYINPDFPTDRILSIGNWVQGKPGVSNSKKVRDALDLLKTIDIRVPVWDQVRGQGANTDYRIFSFALIRILDYRLPGQSRITVRFLGFVTCGDQNFAPIVNAGGDQSITLPDPITLVGTVNDEGLPAGAPITTEWSLVDGPAEVNFGNQNSLITTVTFTEAGDYRINLSASDSELAGSQEITITVNQPNFPPEAESKVVTTLEDTGIDIHLTGSDPDGDALTFTVKTQPSFGLLLGTAPDLRYIPIADYHGSDAFTFLANDGSLDSEPATIQLKITPVNDPPTADPQSLSTVEDAATPVDIVLSGADIDGDGLVFTVVQNPISGVLSGIKPNLMYTPNPDFNGLDSLTYIANDGAVDSEVASVDITVDPINDQPVANNLSVVTEEDTDVEFTITASDVDGDTLTFTITTQPENGLLSGTAPDLTYTPNTNFSGSDGFTFLVNDEFDDSTEATVTLTINPVNDAPTVDNQSVNTLEDSPLTITLTGADIDSSTLSFSITTAPTNGILTGEAPDLVFTPNTNFHGADSFTVTANDGLLYSLPATIDITIDPVNDIPEASDQVVSTAEDTPLDIVLIGSDVDGDPVSFALKTQPANGTLNGDPPDLTYDPNPNFNGSDSFTFVTNDGGTVDSDPGTVTINVHSSNDPPVTDDQFVTTSEDTPVDFSLTAADIDGDTLTFIIVTPPTNGLIAGDGPEFTYTPSADFNGSDDFTFVANDGTEDSPEATLTITVNPINDLPLGVPQNVTTPEDSSVVILLTGSDVEGDTLTFRIDDSPTSGNVSGTPPEITYTPNPDFSGPDSFTFIANDGSDDSLPVIVSINVNPVNDSPVADDQSIETVEDASIALTLTAADIDGDDVTFTISTPPENGNLTGVTPDLIYTPNPNFNSTDTFMFTVNDGIIDSPPATVTVTVTPINDTPEANDLAVNTDEDSTDFSIVLTATDPDDDTLTFTIVNPPQFGTLKNSLSPPTSMLTEIPAEVFYTPDPDFNGSDVFTFIANDGTLDSEEATVNIAIQPVNDAPVADEQTVSIPEDSPAAITLTAADIDDDPLTFVIVSQPQNGVLNGTPPNLAYTPNPDFNGSDTIIFKVNDGDLDSDDATVTIDVDSLDDPPIITSTPITIIDFGETYTYDVEADDPDSDDVLTFSLDTAPEGMSIDATSGLIIWDPQANQVGDHPVIVRVDDSDGLFDSQEFTITVVDTMPTITIDAPADGLVTFQNAIDIRGSIANAVSVAVNGIEAAISGDGYTAPDIPLSDGPNTIIATAENASGSTATASITIVRDLDFPVITILTPEENAVIPEFAVTIQGAVIDDSLSEFTINGNAVQVVNEGFLHTVPLLNEGENRITFIATDDIDNTSTLELTVIRDTGMVTEIPQPVVIIPATTTNASDIALTGVALPDTTVQVDGGDGQITVITDSDGKFTIDVPLIPNQLNRLFVTNLDDSQTSAPFAVEIIQDSEPPFVFVDFPEDGEELTNDTIVVAGRVGDMLSGFMGLDVTVNGISAEVIVGIGTNGTFEAENVPLTAGTNTIEATATDIHGNTITQNITVEKIDIPTGAASMVALSGDLQTAQVNTQLPDPIVVKLTQGDGSPFADKLVTFEVTRSDGRVTDDSSAADSATIMKQIRTDTNGEAAVFWTLGADAGCGNNRIAVTSADVAGSVFFCASADPAPAAQINIGSGENQRAAVDGPAPEKLRVWVNDSCNGVAGTPVTYTVKTGEGKVNGADSATVLTSITGHTDVNFQLGPIPGNNVVEANFPGNSSQPATFTIFGVESDETIVTLFSGLIVDNSGSPIGGAECILEVAGTSLPPTLSNIDGVFEFIDIPAGPGHLHIDGFVATTLDGNPIPEGSYPALSYEVIIIENAENTLPTPVILPELDITNAVTYNGTQDVELTVDSVDGLKMTVKAGSMRRADGSAPSPADPAILSLDQVHHDDVPMPMPDGVSPPFAWTLQPAGATFDPPIQIEYPNMTGLSAGSISYFLSFNHDTNRFEIVATGTVSADGSTIISDPGVGIGVAGWGCNCPPYAVAGACINCAVDCLETGSLSEGEGAVDKSLVCVGESVTFSVTTDSVDNGGIKQFNCPDSTITDFDGPVAPSYSWVISGPGNSVSGNGNTVTFTPPTNGTYSCQFTATANRDCPPPPVSFSGGSFIAAQVTSITSSESVVCVNESVTFTANGGPFPFGKPTWTGGGSPANGSGALFTTSWPTPGTKTVTAKCLGSGLSTTIKVVEVGALTAKGVTSTAQTAADAEEVVVCLGPSGATTPITAIPNPSPFPSGELEWSTGESGVTSIDFPIDVAGTFPVSASCNTSTRHIKIIPMDVKIETDDLFCVNQPNVTASITGVPAGVTVNLVSTKPSKVQFSQTSITGSGSVGLVIGSQPSNSIEDITLSIKLPDGSSCFEKKITVFHIESSSGVLCIDDTASFLSDLEPSGPPTWISTVAGFMNFLSFDTVKVTDPGIGVSDVITGFSFFEELGQLKIQVTSGNNPEDVLMRFKLFGVQLHQEHMTIVDVNSITVADHANPANNVMSSSETTDLFICEPLSGNVSIDIGASIAPAGLGEAESIVLWKVERISGFSLVAEGNFNSSNPSLASLDTSGGDREFKVSVGCDRDRNGELDTLFETTHCVFVSILQLESETAATLPLDRTRTKLGVGEEVTLTLQPISVSPITWSIVGEGILSATTGNIITFTAHNRESTASITATFNAQSCSINFTVVEPDGVILEQEPETGIFHINGTASVGFRGRPFITPNDVSFINIQVREFLALGIGTGFYAFLNNELHELGDWNPIIPGTSSKPNKLSNFDEISSGVDPPPFSDGTFLWPIPWQFRVNGGSEKQFAIVNHEQVADSSGRVTLSKGGVTVTKDANDPNSNF